MNTVFTDRLIRAASNFIGRIYVKIMAKKFAGSENYWIKRYESGRNSGSGSYKKFADFKAEVINKFVTGNEITSVIEYGCGGGNQLTLSKYPKYLGFDVSPAALALCKQQFAHDTTKNFKLMAAYEQESAELTLSLDVIYHLTEDDVFECYIDRLFSSASRHVIIYSSDKTEQDEVQAPHVRHRKFSDWVAKHAAGWELIQHVPNKYPYKGDVSEGSSADFYIYKKR